MSPCPFPIVVFGLGGTCGALGERSCCFGGSSWISSSFCSLHEIVCAWSSSMAHNPIHKTPRVTMVTL